MAEPTIGQVFGNGVSQDIGGLIISKADMEVQGLTALVDNRAESMLVSIILTAASSLTEENRLTDLPQRNISISYSGQDLIDQGGGNVFLRDTYQISLYKQTSIQPIDPDNY